MFKNDDSARGLYLLIHLWILHETRTVSSLVIYIYSYPKEINMTLFLPPADVTITSFPIIILPCLTCPVFLPTVFVASPGRPPGLPISSAARAAQTDVSNGLVSNVDFVLF